MQEPVKVRLITFNELFSWTAVFVGALVGLGLNFLFNLLSLSIGISIFMTTEGKTEFSIVGFIAFLLVGILSMFFAGCVAGYLSPTRITKNCYGILYGFIAWAICLIMTTILLMNMIQFGSFHANFSSQPNLVAIRIANDKPMMTETKSPNTTALASSEKSEQTTKTITLNSYITFFLFLTGAIFSCLGGYLGLRRAKENFSFSKNDSLS